MRVIATHRGIIMRCLLPILVAALLLPASARVLRIRVLDLGDQVHTVGRVIGLTILRKIGDLVHRQFTGIRRHGIRPPAIAVSANTSAPATIINC
jgi:hypothetical protein